MNVKFRVKYSMLTSRVSAISGTSLKLMFPLLLTQISEELFG